MAAIKRGRKADALRRSQRSKSQKALGKRGKLPSRPRRNVCMIRFPRSSYLTACPLVSWYFDRCMRHDLLWLQKGKPILSPCVGGLRPKMSLRLLRRQQRPGRKCPDFLQAALREVASKKRARWVVASPRKRRHYSDEKIFYRLAKPSGLADEEDSSSAGQPGPEDAQPHTPGIPHPAASELQEALS
ncbi:putative ATP-dependent RNA helicase [Varanus komodoensis]|nr:putative ATP-dependent RNA helicase [Varanus komodoensis]